MGLSRAAIVYLLEEARRRPFSGRALTLGVQSVAIGHDEIDGLATAHGVGAPAKDMPDRRAPLTPGMASADWLFRRLGFDELVETDVSDFEDAALIFDLNAPEVPEGHRGRYDLVLDSGTLEHVFHLPNALRNVLDFAAPGGRIVHMAPSSNHIDHGFFMFSPTFFWDFYTANGLEPVRCDLYRYDIRDAATGRWLFGAYRPGALHRVSMGRLGPGCWGVAVVVDKTAAVERMVIPQQGAYVGAWAASEAPPPDAAPPGSPSLRRRLEARLPPGLRLRLRALRARFPLRPTRWL